MESSADGTAERLEREALLAQNEHLRWLLTANSQLPWSADADGNVTDLSSRWLELTGLERAEAINDSWMETQHPDDAPRMLEAWMHSVSTGEPYDLRHRIRLGNGSYRWMRSRAISRRDDAGRIIAWYGNTEDVHEATAATERLSATADALPALVFHVDTTLVYRFVNRHAAETFKQPREGLLGRTIREIVGETTYGNILPFLQQALRGERTGWAMWIDFPSGRRFMRTTYVPSWDSNGNVVGIDVLAADETEAKLAEQALELSEAALLDANEELEKRVDERAEGLMRANRDLNEFAYSVAHDLRAPLRAIVSTSSILMEEASDRLTEKEIALLDRQSKAATKLAKIVDDLLGFARLANRDLQKKPLNITAIARSVADDIGSRWGRESVEVQPGMTAEGDPGLVSYVFVNLLDNAHKFSPDGGAIRVGEKNGVFFVEDHGVGFSMVHAHKLFVAFERLVDQETFEGTGVGLANVKRIVERHGGEVWAKSEPGRGATFFFTLQAQSSEPQNGSAALE